MVGLNLFFFLSFFPVQLREGREREQTPYEAKEVKEEAIGYEGIEQDRGKERAICSHAL